MIAHGIALKYRGGGTPEMVASHVTQTAGGRYDFANSSNSLPDKLHAIAEQINRDYEQARTTYDVAFLTDAIDAPVSIGVAREGVVLQTTSGRLR